MNYTHRIYVKHPEHTNGRFYPINGDGGFARNLIYASMFSRVEAESTAEKLSAINPEFTFQVRKI